MRVILCLILTISFYSNAFASPKVTILIPKHPDDKFWELVIDVSHAAAQNLKTNLDIIYAGAYRIALQKHIDEIIQRANKPDYLIFHPYDGNAEVIFNKLEVAKIKFVTLEYEFTGELRNKMGQPKEQYNYWVDQINFDNHAGSRLLLNTLINHQKKISPHRPISITGVGGDFDKVAIEREMPLKEFQQHNQDKNIKINQIFPMNFSAETVNEKFDIIDKRYPNTNVFWCASDLMALTIQKNLNGKKNISIGGFDWLPETMTKIEQGEITASVGGQFLMIAMALIKIKAHELDAKTLPSSVYQYDLVTKDNVARYRNYFKNKQWQDVDYSQFITSKDGKSLELTINNLINQATYSH